MLPGPTALASARPDRGTRDTASSLRLYADAGHLLPEERASEVADDVALLVQRTDRGDSSQSGG